MNTKIAYLVPSYNHSKYICSVLDSIYEDATTMDETWELIIIDDGSTDGSVKLIYEWLEKHSCRNNIAAISRENKGLGATLNELILKSSAELIRLCSSDDLLISGSTSAMLVPFSNFNELLCVVGDGVIVNENGNKLHDSSIKYHGGKI